MRPFKDTKIIKNIFQSNDIFFLFPCLTVNETLTSQNVGFCQNTQARQSIENLHIKYPGLFHTGLSPQLFG